ncbi:MAG: serine hydrolase, partial [Planctomycetales bacterium]|nr:serine hydrolase [Planctomycetales bacterium]
MTTRHTFAVTVALILCGQHSPLPAADPSEANCKRAADYSEANGGFSVLVMVDGKIVFERYGKDGGTDKRHGLASGTKSFVGVAAVAAVEDGLIRLDDKVCESLTEWNDDPLKSQITYRQLLTLTSGLTGGERGAAVRSPGWKEIVGKPMSGKPGQQFEYGAFHLCAFAEALQRRLKRESFEEYLTRRVLKPLGINLEWRVRCDDKNPQVGGGGAMNARDWAKFGEFMRLEGQSGGKQIVRKDLLAECTKGTKQNPAYGLTWWLREPVPEDIIRTVPILQRDMGDIVKSDWLPEDLFLAAGAGKQRLYVIPSTKLVVVRQGDIAKGRIFSDAEFLDRLLRGNVTSESQAKGTRTTPARSNANTAGMGGAIFGRLDANADGKVS